MHSMDYDMSAEIDKKAYLRRKVSRGKECPAFKIGRINKEIK